MTSTRTTPISQVEIENELLRLLSVLEEQTEHFEVLAVTAGEAEAQYKKRFAREFIQKVGTEKERASWAEWTVAEDSKSYRIADGLMRAGREKLLSIRTSIEALRTLSASVRSQT
jgi:hypothetical protein